VSGTQIWTLSPRSVRLNQQYCLTLGTNFETGQQAIGERRDGDLRLFPATATTPAARAVVVPDLLGAEPEVKRQLVALNAVADFGGQLE
jgi:hypothetical protein